MATSHACHSELNSFHNNLVEKIIQHSPTESLVDSTDEDKQIISEMIHSTMPQLDVKQMQTVKNSFLEATYLLKKEEYRSRYGREPEEKLLLHVTSASNVNSIISDNFDWRRVTRGKFGLGTSFSGDAQYANHYANYDIGEKRAIIVSSVLVCNTTTGYGIPHANYDTAMGNGGKVYVKFCDNEILPKYVIYYKSSVSRRRHHIDDDFDYDYDDYLGLNDDQFDYDYLNEDYLGLNDHQDDWLDDYLDDMYSY